MTTFLDGPAQNDGQFIIGSKPLKRAPTNALLLKRAPHYLRAVIARDGSEIDALDQLDDIPQPDEIVVAYVMVSGPSSIHICARGKNNRSGWYQGGQYRMCEPQPTEAQLRDTEQWRAWVSAQVGKPIDPETGTVQGAQP